MAASLAAQETMIFNRSLFAEMGFDMSEPTVLWVDNMGAVECTQRRESLSRSRHIERRYLKILEWVAEGKIIVKYKNTKENHVHQAPRKRDLRFACSRYHGLLNTFCDPLPPVEQFVSGGGVAVCSIGVP